MRTRREDAQTLGDDGLEVWELSRGACGDLVFRGEPRADFSLEGLKSAGVTAQVVCYCGEEAGDRFAAGDAVQRRQGRSSFGIPLGSLTRELMRVL